MTKQRLTKQRLTKEQAAIIGAYTGVTCGPFSDIQEYAEKKLGRQIWTNEFGRNDLVKKLEIASKQDFLDICFVGDKE